MDDWRKKLDASELREVEIEDEHLLATHRKQRKRAQDAMRKATQRAGAAAVPLTENQLEEMFAIYMAAQKNSEREGRPYDVDHLIPLHGCWRDAETGRKIHYIRGLHVPNNLRAIPRNLNQRRSNMIFTSEPLIVPKPGEFDPLDEFEPHFGVEDDDEEIPF